ncbi:hypothetical protein JTP68_06970 [Dietzia cinnamea]|uniref:hypothetical protein n=1 Tax=Dietzia cinnamea TaxID=321318 RepID=UPI000D61E2E9|nr:hypothetical protein [Dietzia cinnamea]MBM7230264.1 hypothetical protein [Dietzia cinnamea]MCT2173990.1 hypothetical protein [Dietzia cinnamea]MCT2263454.1 hypothetical protein [Dietzia cinnamea]PWD96866.1 hypothetical protein DEQ16_03185 [Dietzia maris]
MDDLTGRPVAERVRTVLARGASGTVGAGMLRRPLRSARVRDDGVVVLVVDVGGASREAGDAARVAAAGASATVEIVDAVCTGRCRGSAPRPSFSVDGRPAPCGGRGQGHDDECAVARGIVTLSGIVTASSAVRRRRVVAVEGGGPDGSGDVGSVRLSELQPLEISYVEADGVHLVARSELAAAGVDPIAVEEQAWLRRLADDPGLAARLAQRAGRQVAGARPCLAGIDSYGIDVSIGSVQSGFRELFRVEFPQVCADSDDVHRALAELAR